MSFPCTGCPLLASGSRKINQLCAAYVLHANGAVRKRRAHVYKVLGSACTDVKDGDVDAVESQEGKL